MQVLVKSFFKIEKKVIRTWYLNVLHTENLSVKFILLFVLMWVTYRKNPPHIRNMKTIYIIFSVIIILTGCSNNLLQDRRSKVQAFIEEKNKLKVLTTTEMIGDLVRQVGKERVLSLSMITKGLDPHSYELVKGDDELLYSSDLIFSNGLGLEHGASLSSFLKCSKKNVFLGDLLLKQNQNKLVYVDGVIDPHIWMDISLWSELVDSIVQNLSACLPEDAKYFEKNGQILKEKMLGEHKNLLELLQKIPEQKRYLVTSHDSFNYFTKVYLRAGSERDWKERFMAPEGLSPEMQLSIVDIQKIVDHLDSHQIKVIFAESGVSQDSIRKVLHAAKKKNLSVHISEKSLYADSMMETNEEIPYLEMMRYNAKTLYEELTDER